jgi:hypothetical protein
MRTSQAQFNRFARANAKDRKISVRHQAKLLGARRWEYNGEDREWASITFYREDGSAILTDWAQNFLVEK